MNKNQDKGDEKLWIPDRPGFGCVKGRSLGKMDVDNNLELKQNNCRKRKYKFGTEKY